MSELVFVTHTGPMGGQAPYYIARVDLSYAGLPGQVEQVWLKDVGQGRFRLESIPFCASGLAYGDTVRLDERDTYLESVEATSGNRVFRILISPALTEDEAATICDDLIALAIGLNIAYERHGERFLAFNVSPDVDFAEILQLTGVEKEKRNLFREWGDRIAFSGPSSNG